MIGQEQTEMWEDVKEIWGNSSKGEKINFQVSKLINELKGKMSQFEKDSVKKDGAKITSLLRKFLNKIRKKN